MSAVGSSRNPSLLTERKTLKVCRTINMSLLRSEENLRSQNLAKKKTKVTHLLHSAAEPQLILLRVRYDNRLFFTPEE